jgi:serine/threonine protein kinase
MTAKYRILDRLGAGGMGSVFRAEDTKIRQEVALKLIRPEISSSRKTIERFRNDGVGVSVTDKNCPRRSYLRAQPKHKSGLGLQFSFCL